MSAGIARILYLDAQKELKAGSKSYQIGNCQLLLCMQRLRSTANENSTLC